ncbi:F-box protein At5g07610-like [Rutidosis leptorrhynchoides]|uniref:F-box protein At5g07610-like n=1 Tax=Rutidosis leptorrhynchoides TaxID=125765 RepID=UPI003A99EF03
MPTDDHFMAAKKVGSSQDLVTEILLRLPVRSLIMFKSVCKHWYFVITNHPCFKNPNNKPPDPPSGLFVRISRGYVFVPFDLHNPVKFPILKNYGPNRETVQFKHSCNGLILCGNLNGELLTDNSYVCNPTINQYICLPVCLNGDCLLNMSIAFDPLISPHYKVIYVYRDLDPVSVVYNYQIDMYSSQTRTCKVSHKFNITKVNRMAFTTGVYWKNAVHWLDKVGLIVYFDLEQEMTCEIEAPFARQLAGLDDYENYLCDLFESRDQLLLVEIYRPVINKLKIYELKRDYSDWLVKYHVDFEDFGGYPVSRNVLPYRFDYLVDDFDVLSLVLGSYNDDESSFLVVETTCGKIMRLDLESKTCHELGDITCYHRIKYRLDFEQRPDVQFAASLYNLYI